MLWSVLSPCHAASRGSGMRRYLRREDQPRTDSPPRNQVACHAASRCSGMRRYLRREDQPRTDSPPRNQVAGGADSAVSPRQCTGPVGATQLLPPCRCVLAGYYFGVSLDPTLGFPPPRASTRSDGFWMQPSGDGRTGYLLPGFVAAY